MSTKTLTKIRDESAENAWLSPDVPTSTPTDYETFITLYCAGFDEAVAHMQPQLAKLVEALEKIVGSPTEDAFGIARQALAEINGAKNE